MVSSVLIVRGHQCDQIWPNFKCIWQFLCCFSIHEVFNLQPTLELFAIDNANNLVFWCQFLNKLEPWHTVYIMQQNKTLQS